MGGGACGGPRAPPPLPPREPGSGGFCRRDPGKEVSDAGIDRSVSLPLDLPDEDRLGEDDRLLPDPAAPVDDRRDPRVGRADQKGPVFHRAEDRHGQVLRGGRAPPVPGVVGDVDQESRSVPEEAADLAGEIDFVADGHPETTEGRGKDRCFSTRGEVADGPPGELLDEAQEGTERDVLPERDQVDLVIALEKGTVLGDEEGAVVEAPVIEIGAPQEEEPLRLAGEAGPTGPGFGLPPGENGEGSPGAPGGLPPRGSAPLPRGV